MNARTPRRTRLRPLALATLVAAALPLGLFAQPAAGGWTWSVTPYAWATDVGVDVELGDRRVLDADIPVEDLLEDLDTILQLRLEGRKGRHGLFLDLFDVNLSDDARTVALPGGAGSAALTPAMGMTIAELGGLLDPRGDGAGLQLLYGARVLDQRADLDAAFDLADGGAATRTLDLHDTFVDALVGLRFVQPFGGRWGFQVQADVSTGGTDLTWSVEPAFSCAFGDRRRYAALAGYRRMVVDFEASDSAATLDATMTLAGPYLALRVGF